MKCNNPFNGWSFLFNTFVKNNQINQVWWRSLFSIDYYTFYSEELKNNLS